MVAYLERLKAAHESSDVISGRDDGGDKMQVSEIFNSRIGMLNRAGISNSELIEAGILYVDTPDAQCVRAASDYHLTCDYRLYVRDTVLPILQEIWTDELKASISLQKKSSRPTR